jgi:hypothetical protein
MVAGARVRGNIWYRPVMFGLACAILTMGLMISLAHLGAYVSRDIIGVDYRMFSELGRRWAEDGSMYAPFQFSPYSFSQGSGTNNLASMPGLYPPIAAPVFALVRVLPPVLWWALPLGVIALALARWRPAPWAWPLLAAATLSPNLTGVLATGGSTMWVAAGIAVGLLFGWPTLIVIIKPTFAPLLLLGARRRSFWIGASILGAMSVLMLPEWARYLEAIRNAESPGLLYSLGDLPFVLVPLIGYASRRPVAQWTPIRTVVPWSSFRPRTIVSRRVVASGWTFAVAVLRGA